MERYELRAFPRRGQCDRRLPNDPQPNSDRRGRAPVDHCQRLWNCPFTEGVKSPPWFPCFTVRQMRSMMPVQMPIISTPKEVSELVFQLWPSLRVLPLRHLKCRIYNASSSRCPCCRRTALLNLVQRWENTWWRERETSGTLIVIAS